MEIIKVENGSPADLESRLPRERHTYELLEQLQIPFLRVDHQPAATIADCSLVDQELGVDMCKNLFLTNAQRTKFYLLLMPGEKKFKTKDLSKQINSARLSFGEGEYMEKFLEISPGAVSVMGLMNDREQQVQLLIDRDILGQEFLGCHPCVNTSSMRISMKDILEKFLPALHREYIEVVL
ncbi:MAG TPA: prolyl-tRNA synthetase associated domain-containing protein [Candidatus Egerieimonas intestinavium]|uniref:Prolyl-tRNA synthetase associated domain-containing protein n=1 Tax=Candidatus Egerieimonas intestinavium TaxID=2840777 RepID=A0A9D1JFH2_9FIRM|nr:prolyl-tRNA synthetase associated domain-containing protein [Candidatus Egerieimonas intestinavium]